MGTGSMCPFLVLRVRRGPNLLTDTLLQVRVKQCWVADIFVVYI